MWRNSPPVLWGGLEAALKAGQTRAIGVSNYKVPQLSALKGKVPAVNQCEMSVKGSFGQPGHDEATIGYCQKHGITYESYGTLKGCPFTDARVQAMTKAHNVSAAQVCLRWVLQRGAIVATGTGNNTAKVATYAHDDLNVFGFSLTDAEVDTLNKMQDE